MSRILDTLLDPERRALCAAHDAAFAAAHPAPAPTPLQDAMLAAARELTRLGGSREIIDRLTAGATALLTK